MSEDEDKGEIKLNHSVANLDIYDSDEEDEGDLNFENIDFTRKRSDSIDDSTEENALILENLLQEIAQVEAVGKKQIRVELHNTKNIKFLPKKEKIDLDTNEHGYPYIPTEGEEYLLPFLQKLKGVRKELKGIKIETNIPGISFSF